MGATTAKQATATAGPKPHTDGHRRQLQPNCNLLEQDSRRRTPNRVEPIRLVRPIDKFAAVDDAHQEDCVSLPKWQKVSESIQVT